MNCKSKGQVAVEWWRCYAGDGEERKDILTAKT